MVGGIPELPWGLQAHRRRGRRSSERLVEKTAVGWEGAAWRSPDMLQQGGLVLGEGSPCWGKGSREDRGQEWMQEKRQVVQTSGEDLGAGREEEAGRGPWTSGPRPRHLLSFRISPGCLALGAERSWRGRACWAGVPRLSDRWGHERSWRSTAGNLEDRANDGKQASDSGTWCSAFCKFRSETSMKISLEAT